MMCIAMIVNVALYCRFDCEFLYWLLGIRFAKDFSLTAIVRWRYGNAVTVYVLFWSIRFARWRDSSWVTAVRCARTAHRNWKKIDMEVVSGLLNNCTKQVVHPIESSEKWKRGRYCSTIRWWTRGFISTNVKWALKISNEKLEILEKWTKSGDFSSKSVLRTLLYIERENLD